MPMKRHLYAADWPAISRQIKERDGHKCAWCDIPNNARGYRKPDGGFVEFGPTQSEARPEGAKLIRIVLTVAHIDHDPANNDPANLAALCQRCHLRYDAEQHRVNASATRARKAAAGVGVLFEEA